MTKRLNIDLDTFNKNMEQVAKDVDKAIKGLAIVAHRMKIDMPEIPICLSNKQHEKLKDDAAELVAVKMENTIMKEMLEWWLKEDEHNQDFLEVALHTRNTLAKVEVGTEKRKRERGE